jgi:3-oxoacyl-[acyl-carrier-protein] synthase-1
VYKRQDFQFVVMSMIPPDLLPELAVPGMATRGWEQSLVVMAHRACEEALRAAGPGPMPLHSCWPDHKPGWKSDAVVADLLGKLGGRCVAGTVASGRAGGFIALGAAMDDIASGRTAAALVVGSDNFDDAASLGTFLRDNRIKTPRNSDGFIPGMAAGAVLVTTADWAQKHGVQALARVDGVATATTPGPFGSEDVPYTGEGMALAMAALRKQVGAIKPCRNVMLGLNGERIWAKEWGVASVRHAPFIAADVEVTHPADTLGEVGAATTATFLALAAKRLSREMNDMSQLIAASSDTGLQGVFLMSPTVRNPVCQKG